MNNSLSELQVLQLNLFKEFIAVCESLSLRYFMVEGTMLGATRHQGFIPWDDDVDVAMPREDYEIFVEKAGLILNKRYKVTTHSDNDHFWMTAIMWDMESKVQLSNATEKIVKNAWIDIIPLDGMPSGRLQQKLHYCHAYYYRALFQASHFSKIVNINRPRPWIEKKIVALFQTVKLEELINSKKTGDRLHRVMSKYKYDESEMVMQLISDYGMKELMPRWWFGKGKEFTFENTKAQGVQEEVKYLSRLYGDYNQLPPPEKRVGKHNASILK